MTEDEAVRLLEELIGREPEGAHTDADDVITQFLAAAGYPRVAQAYKLARDRVGFWYA